MKNHVDAVFGALWDDHDVRIDFDPSNGRAAIISSLRQSLAKHQVALVLGAGVSDSSGIPRWNPLIRKISEALFFKSKNPDMAGVMGTDSLSQIRRVRFLEKFPPLSLQFRQVLLDEMYKDYAPGKVNPEIEAIASMLVEPALSIDTVVTYNFDDVLETTLNAITPKPEYCVVHSDLTLRRATSRRRIYHPHGYLPRNISREELVEAEVVFAESQYHQQYYDQSNWCNVVQLRTFMERRCLFVGVSLDDPNQRRLLDSSNRLAKREEKHVSIQISWRPPGADRDSDLRNHVIETDLNDLNIDTLWVEKPDEIAPLLRSLW